MYDKLFLGIHDEHMVLALKPGVTVFGLRMEVRDRI
jgi:hypothetical protein